MRALVVAVAMLLPVAASAAEIKLMCPAPMRTSVVELVAQFEKATSHKVNIVHIPSRFIVERVTGGEPVDALLLTANAADGLIKAGKLARRVDYAKSSIGVAVKSGAPKPDVSTADAFKRTMLAAKSFARNEGAESGIHVLAVFQKLGIAEEMKAKTKAMPINTGYVAQLVANGEAEIAAQQMPELHAVAGVDPTPLPDELQLIIPFVVGVSSAPQDAKATEELVTFLTAPAAASVLKSKGLNPPN
jgi:molybdate transport system substrate-binding protein